MTINPRSPLPKNEREITSNTVPYFPQGFTEENYSAFIREFRFVLENVGAKIERLERGLMNDNQSP